MKRLKVVADENIPYVRESLSPVADVTLATGSEIHRSILHDADALLVRSVTRVDAEMLAGTPVSFVGAATIGTDHIDVEGLVEGGVQFAHAPGSNAESVVNYVSAALIELAVREGTALRGKIAGVVGCGNIGGRLVRHLPFLGVEVLKCDPYLAETAPDGEYVDFEEVLRHSDIVSFHVPLSETGPYPTHHMLNPAVLRRLKPGAWVMNTSRGAVVDNAALFGYFEDDSSLRCVMDVWENEPLPYPGLIARSFIATPHIAGYSLDGKLNGARMVLDALGEHFGIEVRMRDAEGANDLVEVPKRSAFAMEAEWLKAVIRPVYDIMKDDGGMRQILRLEGERERAAAFHSLRKDYPVRRDFSKVAIDATDLDEAARATLLRGLGFSEAPVP